jgi:hypothetical protein
MLIKPLYCLLLGVYYITSLRRGHLSGGDPLVGGGPPDEEIEWGMDGDGLVFAKPGSPNRDGASPSLVQDAQVPVRQMFRVNLELASSHPKCQSPENA